MMNTTSFKALSVAAVLLLCSCSSSGNTQSDLPEITENSIVSDAGTISSAVYTTVANNALADSGITTDRPEQENMIYAHIGENVLPIELCDNSSADAFRELVNDGLTIKMHDYGGFEKVGQLDTELPRNDEQISVSAGDVILYQGNSVTIYYNTNSWSFTRLGKVKGLTENEIKYILSADSVEVTFSAEP